LLAATLVLCLAAPMMGCAEKVAPPPAKPQGQVLLPPPSEKPGGEEIPRSISRRPPPPVAPPPPPQRLPAPVEAVPVPPPAGPAAPVVPAGVKVALLLPLSGPDAAIGQSILDAAQMALFDMADENFTLLPRDTGGSPDGAVKAANDVISQGAQLILGPLLAQDVAAIAPQARAAHVPVVAFSTDASVAGDGIFLMGLLPRQQVTRVVAFAATKGHKNFAALVPDNPYGARVEDALREAATQAGGAVTQVEHFPPGGDATEAVRRLASYETRHAALESQMQALEGKDDEISKQALARLKEMNAIGDVAFDSVMIAEGGERLRAVAPLLPYYDVDTRKVQLLGTSLWDDPALGTEPSLVGGWFAAPDPGPRAQFAQRFAALTGRQPQGFASLGYDAAALAAVLAKGPNGPDFSPTALTAEQGFAGVDGIFRFLPTGLSERGLAVLEMQRNELKVVDPAPTAFTKVVY
jgi:ABC-type branched-subunit amino acid transport system substrate-binding protein